MFFGSYQHNLDAKGRLMIPARFKNEAGNVLYVMKGFDGALSVYKETEFQKLIQSAETLPFNKRDSRDYLRIQLASVRELEIDKLGRILLPKELLNKYHIGKEVIVIGVGDHMEIWDRGAFEEYEKKTNEAFEDIAENLGKVE